MESRPHYFGHRADLGRITAGFYDRSCKDLKSELSRNRRIGYREINHRRRHEHDLVKFGPFQSKTNVGASDRSKRRSLPFCGALQAQDEGDKALHNHCSENLVFAGEVLLHRRLSSIDCLGIARALAMEPKVLLFDEPTSALDPEMVGEVLDVIQKLARTGVTLVVVTHEMGFARRVANRVVFMDAGRIVEVGPPNSIFDAPQDPRLQTFQKSILPA